MTLLDLQAFLAVIRYGTVAKASEALYISHSTLSWRLTNLEEELGTELMIRKKGIKKVRLTPAGSAFLPYAETIVENWEKALDVVQEASSPAVNFILCYGHSLLFERLYHRFYEQYPDAHLYYMLRHSEEAYEMVSSRKMDAGIVAIPCSNKKVRTIPLADEDEVLLCGSNSPLFEKDIITLADLDLRSCVRWWLPDSSIEDWFTSHFPNQPIKRIVSEDLGLLESMLSGSKLWTILPSSTAQIFINRRGNTLVKKKTDFKMPTRHMYLIQRKDHSMHSYMSGFLQLMKTEFESLGMRWLYSEQ